MVRRLLLPVLPIVLLVSGCSVLEGDNADGGAVPAPSTTVPVGEGAVVVKNIAFNPPRVTATVGEEVVWTIDDNGVAHTVTADDGSFDSGRLTTGEFRHVFDTPGEVPYHCEVHRAMKGTVVVS